MIFYLSQRTVVVQLLWAIEHICINPDVTNTLTLRTTPVRIPLGIIYTNLNGENNIQKLNTGPETPFFFPSFISEIVVILYISP